MSKIEKVAKGATSITLAVFLSRILGLIREQVLAYFFGAGKAMDAFVVGYRIPNLLRDLFAEGALGSAFTKVFTSYTEKIGLDSSLKRASLLLSNWIIIISFFVVLGIIFSPQIVSIIAPAFKEDPEKFQLTLSLTRIMMPFLLFISLSAIFAGLLNSLDIFFLPALSSGIFNLSSILIGLLGYYLLLSYSYEPIYAMAFGVSLGGLLQALVQYPLLRKRGFFFTFKWDFSLPEFKETLQLILPVIIGFSAVQINIFINTFFATSCGEGAVSWYNYAFRVMYVPLGLFGVGLAQALLPELTRTLAKGEIEQAKGTYTKALIISLSLSLPSAIGLFILSEPIIKILFERGNFLISDTKMTSEILKILMCALPFYGLSKTTIPLFYALGKTKIPTLGSFISVGVNLGVILATIKTLGILGVALGTTASLIAQALFLVAAASLNLKGIAYKFLLRGLLTLGLSSLILALFLLWSLSLKIPLFLKLIFSIPLGALLFIFLCKLFGPRETYLFYVKLLGIFRKS
ncbi:MAG: murein biosynthesis integral membrane protein MurJ [Caldimicrobium sp.]